MDKPEITTGNTFDRLGFALLVILLFLLPLVVFPFVHSQYMLPKATLLRTGVWLLAFIYLASQALSESSSRAGFPGRHGDLMRLPQSQAWTPLLRNDGARIPLLLFLFALLVSTAFSQNFYLSFFGNYSREESLLTYLSYILILVFSAVFINSTRKCITIFQMISVLFVLIGVLSVLEYLGIFVIRGGIAFELTRSATTIGNPIYQGIFLSTLFPLVIYSAKYGNNRQKFIGFTALLFGIIGLYLTQSRTAIISGAIIIPLSLYFLYAKQRNIRKTLILLLLLAGISLAVITFSPSLGRFSLEGLAEGSLERRLNWINTLHLIKDSPLIGFGLDTYELNSSKYIVTSISIGKYNDKPHNGFLEMVYSLGLAGIASYLWLISYSVLKAYYFLKNAADKRHRHLALMLVMAILAFPAMEFTAFTTPVTTPYFYMAIGLLIGITQKKRTVPFPPLYSSLWQRKGRRDFRTVIPAHFYVIPAKAGIYGALSALSIIIFLAITFWQAKAISADSYFKKALNSHSPSSYWFYERAIDSNPFVAKYYEHYAKKIIVDKIYTPYSAIVILDRGLKYFPEHHLLLIPLGDAYININDAEKALSTYTEALRIAPHDLTIKWGYADALILNKRHKEASSILQQILDKVPDNTDVLKSLEKAKSKL